MIMLGSGRHPFLINSAPPAEGRTFACFLSRKWVELCRSVHFPESEILNSEQELLRLIRPWGDAAIGTSCRYRSYISADGFPAEFSLSWRARVPEVRVLFESLGSDLTPRGAQDAGRRLTRNLVGKEDVDIDRYLAIEDLFVTGDPTPGGPTIWHSMAQRAGEPLRYKVYLNPRAHGRDRVAEVVSEAFERIGMKRAWLPIVRLQAELAEQGHEIEFFALDLDHPDVARVKVYFRHGPVTIDQLDKVASLAGHHDSARAAQAYHAVYGHRRLISNEPMTCLAFHPGAEGPTHANIYLRLGTDPVETVLQTECFGPTIGGLGRRELLSFRTVGANQPAEIGLYLRFPQYEEGVK